VLTQALPKTGRQIRPRRKRGNSATDVAESQETLQPTNFIVKIFLTNAIAKLTLLGLLMQG